jgi:hypothetical protein
VYADAFDFLNLAELAERFAARGFGADSSGGEVSDFGLDMEVELITDIGCGIVTEETVIASPNGLFGYGRLLRKRELRGVKHT